MKLLHIFDFCHSNQEVNLLVTVRLLTMQEKISLSEGSTVDLRKPGEEMDNLSELAEESMEPEECFPECESRDPKEAST